MSDYPGEAFKHPKIVAEIETYKKPNYSRIAEHCGVSDRFVGNLWNELSERVENPNGSDFHQSLKPRTNGHLINPRPATFNLAPEVLPMLGFTNLDQNRQRTKTGEQIGREYKHLKRIYNERLSRQGSNQYQKKQLDNNASVACATEAPPPTAKAAETIGTHKATANKAERVVDAIDELEAQGASDEAGLPRSAVLICQGCYNKL